MRRLLSALVFVSLSACLESSAPTAAQPTYDPAEVLTLIRAMSSSSSPATIYGLTAATGLMYTGTVPTLPIAPGGAAGPFAGNYRVMGMVSNSSLGASSFSTVTLLAWNGYSPNTMLLGNLMVIASFSQAPFAGSGTNFTAPIAGPGSLGGVNAFGLLYNRASNATYVADSGTFTISRWNSPSPAPCYPYGATTSINGRSYTCLVAVGSMDVTLALSALNDSTQSRVSFTPVTLTNVPLVVRTSGFAP